jgi:hypothetical protein
MSVNYTSVIGVGVMEDELDYTSLTEDSKNLLKDIYLDYLSEEEAYDEDGERISNEYLLKDVDLDEWFSNNIGEYELWYKLGLKTITGNYFTGEKGYRGVDVDLNNIESAKEEFRKIVNLEPEVFNGVLVW